jgi:hypothetical protein
MILFWNFSLSGRQAWIGAFLVVDYFPSRLDLIGPYHCEL